MALFERAVGFYAFRIGINAYHQPGVEAGKKAAEGILALKPRLLAAMGEEPQTATAVAARLGVEEVDVVWYVLNRLAANERGVVCTRGASPSQDRFTRGPS